VTAPRRDGADFAELLDTVVVHNAAVRAERRGGAFILWVPIRRRWWMRGDRTLEQIVEEFAARHQVRFHEARLSVLAFVRSLLERNLVALTLPARAPGEETG
jgi:hypothetical protein